MATLSDIRDFVREATLVETDDWSNAKILNVLNEGIRVLSNRFKWPFLSAEATLSVTAGTSSYALSSIAANLTKIEVIVRTGKVRRLEEIASPNAWSQFGGDFPESTEATHFFLWGSKIYLVPTPSATEANAYTVFYYKAPTELANDTDVPEWDSRFHMVLGYWGIVRVWEREEDMEKAAYWRGQFDGEVDRMASFYLNRAADIPTVVGLGHYPRNRINDRVHLPVLDGA